MAHNVFIAGGTGYLGRRLIPELIRRGHGLTALVRSGSESRLPADCEAVVGNALDRTTFVGRISPADTFVQLVGVPHPSPAKARQFREVDLVSARESIGAATTAGIGHFIYVSVAQPAPVMQSYQEVRAEGEAMLRASGLKATTLRPWYILGPGHWWPVLILPGYWLFELWPATRASARRLGLVTLKQMVAALAAAVDQGAAGLRVIEVPEIRQAR